MKLMMMNLVIVALSLLSGSTFMCAMQNQRVSGLTPDEKLFIAVFYEDLPAIKNALNDGACINMQYKNSCTILHYLVCIGEKFMTQKKKNATIAFLLEWGADPTRVNDHLDTALHVAVSKQDSPVVELLLPHMNSAAINETNKEGLTALDLAVENQKITKLLRKYGACIAPKSPLTANEKLREVVYGGYIDGIQNAVYAGAQINACDFQGRTLLSILASGEMHLLSAQEVLNVMRQLLQCKADPALVDSAGCTPLHRAVENNNSAMVSLLISAMNVQELNIKNNNNMTALDEAYARGPKGLAITKILESSGAQRALSLNQQLFRAAFYCDSKSIMRVVSCGVSVNERDEKGWTPLLLVLANNSPSISYENKIFVLNCLLEQGARLDIANNERCTPLHRAVEKGYGDVVALFAKYMDMRTINMKNKEGKTALDIACSRNDENSKSIAQFLLSRGACRARAQSQDNTCINEGLQFLLQRQRLFNSEIRQTNDGGTNASLFTTVPK